MEAFLSFKRTDESRCRIAPFPGKAAINSASAVMNFLRKKLVVKAPFYLRASKPGGFTLIELLSTITIIGIMAAISIPTISAYREKVLSVKCTGNLRQIGVAAALYSTENNGYILPFGDPSEHPTDPLSPMNWPSLLLPYLSRNNPLSSPGDVPVFKCPAVKDDVFGYGLNAVYLCRLDGGIVIERFTMAMAENPSKTILITDSGKGADQSSDSWRAFVRPGAQNGRAIYGHGDFIPQYRHPNGTCNALFLDGHVAGYRESDIPFSSTDFWNGSDKEQVLWKLVPGHQLPYQRPAD